jgi:hypothetical protein
MLSGQSSHTGIREDAAFYLEDTFERQPRLVAQVWN